MYHHYNHTQTHSHITQQGLLNIFIIVPSIKNFSG